MFSEQTPITTHHPVNTIQMCVSLLQKIYSVVHPLELLMMNKFETINLGYSDYTASIG
jgi:hypothetical protein